ncbi:mannose-6-phosphate isomerase, class I [Corynebacterium halotolerans]|uniref:mannose-6-phosphate isomerase, class I n=1 Tax=Corynebacterium halotolerans TaxID=225326 RepID=UPI003CF513E8
MQLLNGKVRAYPWGSRTMLAELRGTPSPSERPEAELWFGAHPAAPSEVAGTPLTEIIAADPTAALGERVLREHGQSLPFLLKLLAADEPLSLQAHPSAAQAREGYAREDAEGIALTAPHRDYKDVNPKPELIVALTDFTAMAGFRPLEQTRELFAALECEALDRYLTMLDDRVDAEEANLRALFTTWITIPGKVRRELIDAIVAAATPLRGREDWIGRTLRNVVYLNERYPGDVGVLGALLLNHIQLEPGEAIYLDAGQLHAYIRGLGVEVMANSDNVLRGGLTSKYVDVPELVRVLDFNSLADPVVAQVAGEYPVPANEFRLTRVSPTEDYEIEHDGPAVALCTRGTLQFGELELGPGEAVWIPASDPAVTVRGGGELFLARG